MYSYLMYWLLIPTIEHLVQKQITNVHLYFEIIKWHLQTLPISYLGAFKRFP